MFQHLCNPLDGRQILHRRHSHFFFKLSGKILYRPIGQTGSDFCDVAIFFPHHFPRAPDLHSAEIFHRSASELLMEKMLQRRPAHIKNITKRIHIELLLNMLLHIMDDLNQSGAFQMCCLFRQFKPFGIVCLFFPLPAQPLRARASSPAAKISASILFFMKKAPFRGQTVPNTGKRPVRDDYIRFFLPAQGRAGVTNPASALDSRPGMC